MQQGFFLPVFVLNIFFSGGEYHGSIVFSLEHSEGRKSGAMSGLSCLFAVIGLIFANGCAHLALLNQNTLWMRICFLIGAVGGLISYLLKKYCHETPAFIALSSQILEETWFEMIRNNFYRILRTTIVLARISHTFSERIAALLTEIAAQMGEDSVHATRPRATGMSLN
jgi:histone H3/H4